MKFFIPKTKDETQQTEFYAAIRKLAAQTLGWPISDRRVFSIRYRHDGRECLAQVGEHDIDGEVVLAILDSVAYVVCTPNRGAFRGDPILVGKSDASDVVYFDNE